MENASRALLMAGGILVGVLIVTLMITLFLSARDLSNTYDANKQSEAIQQFNENFTRYIGQDITMHQIITLYNFAKIENNKIVDVDVSTIIDGNNKIIDEKLLKADIIKANERASISDNVKVEVVYRIKVQIDEDTGYVSEIKFSNRRFKIITYDTNMQVINTKYEPA